MKDTKVEKLFAENVFTDVEMEKRISKEAYDSYRKTVDENVPLAKKAADEIAKAMMAWAMEKGDLLIYNNGVTHFEKSNEKDPMEILFIAYDKLEITNLPPNSLLPDSYGPIFHTEEMYDVFHRYFTALITEFELKERFYMEICQNISRTLIMYIFRLINRTESTLALLDKSMTIETVLAYIDENFNRKLTLDEIAEKCYTSKYYLSHLFTRFQGVSIGKYILDKKLDESKKMLGTTDLSVAAIAESLGFDDPSYYSRIFKKNVGTTPLQFRKTASLS